MIMKIKYIASSFFCLNLFFACSDKYVAMQRMNVSPQILTSKDSMVLRERDYSNYNNGAGFLRITAKDSMATGMYLSLYDSTKHLEVYYDSTRLTTPVAINQYTVVYIACKDTGTYPLTIKIVDRFYKASQRILPVKVVPNQAPEAVLKTSLVELSPGKGVYTIDASKSFSAMSRIIHYTFMIDNNESTLVTPTIKTTFYSGTHVIGLIVTDDLGKKSDLKTETINIQ